jgi:hypothetical protein
MPGDWTYEVFKSPAAAQWEIYFLRDAGYEVRISDSASVRMH